MLNKFVAVVLCGALVGTGCASASGPRVAAAPAAPVQDRAALAEYVQRLAPGSKVRVERANGSSIKGTLIKATAGTIVVQKNTRVPETPLDVPLDQVTRVTLETGNSMGKTIAISVGVGVGATFGVLLLLAALLGD